MALRAFDFADVTLSHDGLRAAPDTPAWRDRLWARAERGPRAPCAAAALVDRGDLRGAVMLAGIAAYLDPPDVPALATLGHVDALAIALAAAGAPAPLRAAAADALGALPPTPVSLAVVAEVADGPAKPPRPNALAALDALTVRADEAVRTAAAQLRARAKLVRAATGIKRQEAQRDVATGALHPAIALLTADPAFLAALVPPVSDDARAVLVPALLANARAAEPALRAKTFAVLHGGRWRDAARAPLSALARFVTLRERDAGIPLLAVGALAALGATGELLAAAVSGTADVRAAAVAALERMGPRATTDVPRDVVEDAAEQLAQAGDAAASARVRALLPAAT